MEINILNSDKKMLELEMAGIDHVITQLLADALTNDKDVEFAAYKLDHIIDGKPRLIVRTKKGDPLDLIIEKLEQLKEQTTDFRKKFKEATK